MNKIIKRVVSTVALMLVVISMPLNVAYASADSSSIAPLEIVPTCSDITSGIAHWKVTNKNSQAIGFDWTNLSNDAMGSYVAAQGDSELLTSYDKADPNNTTRFVKQDNTAPSQTNAQNVPCSPATPLEPINPVEPACIDGHDQQNLDVSFVTDDTVLITSKDDAVFCDDEDIYFSSYIMPANYDGQGFEGNPTAYPQMIFSSDHVVIHKGEPVARTLSIDLPDSCNNVQVDVYYAPEIRTVSADGHGTQNILSDIYPSTGSCDTGEETGGMGGGTGTTIPTTPTTPVTTRPEGGKGAGTPTSTTSATIALPAELPNTGEHLLAALILVPLMATVISYAAALGYQQRRIGNTFVS